MIFPLAPLLSVENSKNRVVEPVYILPVLLLFAPYFTTARRPDGLLKIHSQTQIMDNGTHKGRDPPVIVSTIHTKGRDPPVIVSTIHKYTVKEYTGLGLRLNHMEILFQKQYTVQFMCAIYPNSWGGDPLVKLSRQGLCQPCVHGLQGRLA